MKRPGMTPDVPTEYAGESDASSMDAGGVVRVGSEQAATKSADAAARAVGSRPAFEVRDIDEFLQGNGLRTRSSERVKTETRNVALDSTLRLMRRRGCDDWVRR